MNIDKYILELQESFDKGTVLGFMTSPEYSKSDITKDKFLSFVKDNVTRYNNYEIEDLDPEVEKYLYKLYDCEVDTSSKNRDEWGLTVRGGDKWQNGEKYERDYLFRSLKYE